MQRRQLADAALVHLVLVAAAAARVAISRVDVAAAAAAAAALEVKSAAVEVQLAPCDPAVEESAASDEDYDSVKIAAAATGLVAAAATRLLLQQD